MTPVARPRPLPHIIAPIALSLAVLAACSSSTDDRTTPAALSSTAASPDTEQTSSPPKATPSPSPTDVAPMEDPANPHPLPEVTAPGTQASFGDTITARKAVGILSEDEGWSVLRYTVTQIEPGDDSLIDTLDDAEDYVGGSVYYVRGTVEVVALFGAGIDGVVGGAIAGVQDDGYYSAGVFGINASPEDCQGDFVISPASVGASEQSCTVALAKPGAEIIAAAYYADSTVGSGGPSDDPYITDPVLWLP